MWYGGESYPHAGMLSPLCLEKCGRGGTTDRTKFCHVLLVMLDHMLILFVPIGIWIVLNGIFQQVVIVVSTCALREVGISNQVGMLFLLKHEARRSIIDVTSLVEVPCVPSLPSPLMAADQLWPVLQGIQYVARYQTAVRPLCYMLFGAQSVSSVSVREYRRSVVHQV